MRRVLMALAVAVLAACGGGNGGGDKPQTAARQWMEAAVAGDDARLRELSTSGFAEQSVSIAAQVREKFSPGEQFKWGGSGKEGEDYAWTATAPGGVVFLKVRDQGGQFKVSEATPSW